MTSLLSFIRNIDFVDNENLQTAILLTGVNQTDHLHQFKTLSLKITNNCPSLVTILQSRDCSNIKSAVEHLVNGFINQQHDHNRPRLKKNQLSLPVLEAWYRHHYASRETKHMLVIMIADFEQFNAACIQELISILCCYTSRIPFVVIAGVATAFKALHNVLPSHITNKMDMNIFQSESSTDMLNKILDEVVLTHRSPFQLSGNSFKTLMEVFLFYDFSLHSFIKGYKLFMLEHFRKQPLSAMLRHEEEIEQEIYGLNSYECQDIRRSFLSFRRLVEREPKPQTRIDLIRDNDTLKCRMVKEINKMRKYLLHFHCSLRILSVLFNDLPKNEELGSLPRELYPSCISSEVTKEEAFEKCYSLLRFTSKDKFLTKLKSVLKILQQFLNEDDVAIEETRELKKDLSFLEKSYSLILEAGMNPVTAVAVPNQTSLKVNSKGFSGRQAWMEGLNKSAKLNHTNHLLEYEQRLNECLDYLREFLTKNLRPIQAAPAFSEFFVFGDQKAVRNQIIGAPRGVLYNALHNPQRILHCVCCVQAESGPIIPTCPDTSIAYRLHLESNKFLNLYDWLQSFALVNGMNADEDEISPEMQ